LRRDKRRRCVRLCKLSQQLVVFWGPGPSKIFTHWLRPYFGRALTQHSQESDAQRKDHQCAEGLLLYAKHTAACGRSAARRFTLAGFFYFTTRNPCPLCSRSMAAAKSCRSSMAINRAIVSSASICSRLQMLSDDHAGLTQRRDDQFLVGLLRSGLNARST